MKLKSLLILCLIFGAFIFVSCEETVEKTKDEPKQLEIQPVYELSLHQVYLKMQIERLKIERDSLDKGSEDYEQIGMQIAYNNDFLTHIEEKLDGIEPPDSDPVPHPVPLPQPIPFPVPWPCPVGNCVIMFEGFSDIVVTNKDQHFEINFTNQKGDVVKGIGKPVDILDTPFQRYPLNIGAADAERLFLNISKLSDFTKDRVSYRLQVELPKR